MCYLVGLKKLSKNIEILVSRSSAFKEVRKGQKNSIKQSQELNLNLKQPKTISLHIYSFSVIEILSFRKLLRLYILGLLWGP